MPGHGARDVMYMAWVNTTTQWQVFSWADNSASVPSTFINVGTMTFGGTDCRDRVQPRARSGSRSYPLWIVLLLIPQNVVITR